MSVFLGKEWNSFHLLGKELDYQHLKDFLKYECELYLKQPLMPSHVIEALVMEGVVLWANHIHSRSPILRCMKLLQQLEKNF
jgi:hypothetical protein